MIFLSHASSRLHVIFHYLPGLSLNMILKPFLTSEDDKTSYGGKEGVGNVPISVFIAILHILQQERDE